MDDEPMPERGRKRSKSPYPTPSKRKRSQSRGLRRTGGGLGRTSKGTDSKDTADVYVHLAPPQHFKSMAEKYAEYKEQPTGVVMITKFRSMRVSTANEWNIFTADDRGRRFEIFTPKKFKDAEAVSFKGKALSENGYATATVAVNGTTLRDMCVIKSFCRVDFKNVTEKTTTIEMYVCAVKDAKAWITTTPEDDLARALDMYSGNSSTTSLATLYVDPMKVKTWTDMWHVKKVKVRLEPGETASHTLYGPKKYVMDPKRHLEIGTTDALPDPGPKWLTPDREGNGFYVFFRMLNDITFGVGQTPNTPNTLMGGRRIWPHHPINAVPPQDGDIQGGVVLRWQEYYKMACPLGVDSVDQRNILVDLIQMTQPVSDVAVDSDQPHSAKKDTI